MTIKLLKTSIVLILLSIISCGNSDKKLDVAVDDIVQDGDIIFQILESSQSRAIQYATKSEYTHVGIIYKIDGTSYVYEAVGPVRLIELDDFINNGQSGHFVVKRLKDSENILTTNKLSLMKEEGEKYKGKPYDFTFEWSNERIYCSELVWKIYMNGAQINIGEMQQLKDLDLSHPSVKEKLFERYGNNIPYNEYIVSPQAIFDSNLLYTVIEG